MTGMIDQWSGLAARIRGLASAGTLHAAFLSGNSNDSFARSKRLLFHANCIVSDCLQFFGDHKENFMPKMQDAFLRHASAGGIFESFRLMEGSTQDIIREQAAAAIVLLSAFEAEVTHLIGDSDSKICRITERAFAHLQRQITVDDNVRDAWSRAYENSEEACEKLGAVHLLSHGIWAYKVVGAGERTDLVYQERSQDLSRIAEFSDGLVLTEWKKVSKNKDINNLFSRAVEQAHRYSVGVLYGSDLFSVRYIVLVSRSHLDVRFAERREAILYKCLNIAIDPRPPSKK
jgi:hypothetical protein